MFYAEKKKKVHWVGMTLQEMEVTLEHMDEPKYRAKQIFQWVYKHRVTHFDEMINLPKSLRNKTENSSDIRSAAVVKTTGNLNSATKKYLLCLSDGNLVESVLMQGKTRTTVCLSTQIGCAVGCRFCATGTMTYQRNLMAGEIVEQFLYLQDLSKSTITNVVFMGMGEPFLNYQNSIKAANLLNAKNGINLGARRITISTAGIVPKIIRFTEEKHRFKLAISLNGTSQKSREKTMPITETYSLKSLMESAQNYYESSKRMITFEYVLLKNVNDSINDAKQLKQLIAGLPCKVNLIPYNEIGGAYERPSDKQLQLFYSELQDARFTVTIRHSKGTTIDAGCGQLVVKTKKGN